LIEDLNRVGRTVFEGDTAKAALFNKDILRGRKRAEKAADATIEGKKIIRDPGGRGLARPTHRPSASCRAQHQTGRRPGLASRGRTLE
jgi:hypothetical protein